ncbi:MAG: PTS sugar transporter subunit IIC [Clostridiales bacterium]|nr:PTS sugar transporter subunit IIC [Clostridiales bacterium]
MENTNEKKPSWIARYAKRYFIDALGAMAKGLFATLLIGTIFGAVATLLTLPISELYSAATAEGAVAAEVIASAGFWARLLYRIVVFLKAIVAVAQNGYVVGAAIGFAIAHGMKVSPLAMFSAAVTGAVGYMSGAGGAGPVGAYIAAIVGAELGNLVSGKTKVDILVVPAVSILAGGLVGYLLGMPLGAFMRWLSGVIGRATYMSPIPMGIVISVVIGLILTAPISSAAVCALIFVVTPDMAESTAQGLLLAAGAATVGCCCQMVGFAVASFRENKWGGLVSQGIGTSMLQVPNIMRHPAILVPPTLAAAILGPISTTLLPMFNRGINAGMGTCGFVGQIGTYITMLGMGEAWWLITIKVLVLHIVLPALIALGVSELMRRLGWIKKGDMLLD